MPTPALTTLLERYRAGVEAYNAGVPEDRADHEQLGLANIEIERQIVAAKIVTKADAIAAIDFIETERDLDRRDLARLFEALRAYIKKAS